MLPATYFVRDVELLDKAKFEEHSQGGFVGVIIGERHVIELIAVMEGRKDYTQIYIHFFIQ